MRFLEAQSLPKLAFLLGLAVLAFTYGVATVYLEIFPYQILREAKRGWEAWQKLEDDRLPVNILSYVEDGEDRELISRLDDRAGSEKILMAGGFHQMSDHCPDHGCIAWVMDRDGQILHTWEADPGELLADGLPGISGRTNELNFYVVGVTALPDGSLIAVFQGRNVFPYQVGLAKFDIDGKLLWSRIDQSHHWPTVDRAGNVYVPYVEIVEDITHFGDTATNARCETGTLYMEGVRILRPDGTVENEFSMLDAVIESDYPGLVYALRDGCDPFHVNGIELVTEAAAAKLPKANVGDLLVSLREPSSLVVLDRHTGAIKHLIGGRASGQHSPRFLPDGSIVVFDNLGGKRALGGSRIVRIDPAADTAEPVYPKSQEDDVPRFWSLEAGILSVSPNGRRILASISRQGSVIEIDVETGKVLWTYDNVINMSAFFDEHDIEADAPYVRFSTQGAYYADNLEFLTE